MSPHRKISLKVISAPATGPVVSAPPVLKASDHTIDYACGNCGAVLLHAEDGQTQSGAPLHRMRLVQFNGWVGPQLLSAYAPPLDVQRVP
jgi:hypothetical protein